VDAALDLSHTQNIGRLLKTHFSQSQFVVVSLKEGMFDNANVVFTTQNVDGVSSVNRTETLNGRSASRAAAAAAAAAGGGFGAGKQAQKRSRLANVTNQ
jgi:structural maintenance of chromosome 2